jgi:diguanylate cyclase (GGDEF)-like protein
MTWWRLGRVSPTRGRARRDRADALVSLPGGTGCMTCGPSALLSDQLTGLPNRFGMKDRLDQEVVCAPPVGPRPAVLMLDLDNFKAANSTHGRETGDEVLKAAADRLSSQLSSHETLYRIGGDEFAVLIDRCSPEEAVSLAGVLLDSISQPMDTGDKSVQLTASIGIVMLGQRSRSDAILRDADLTMHRAKAEGGNRIDIYSGELDYWALSRKRDLDGLLREVEDLRLENQALTEAVMIDPLTGLTNAAAFDADHVQAHARRMRSEEPYAVLIADIDEFHDYTRQVRAAISNQTLRAVAQTIKANVRQGDRAYRYGWPDFVVLLPGALLRDAVVAAERIRAKVEMLGIENTNSSSGVLTVTVGVIEAGFRHRSTKDVVAEVSDLLREGKRAGKNRIVWPH